MIERIVGGTRQGENGGWKYLRLLPIALLVGSIVVGYTALQYHVSALADGLKENKVEVKVHDDKIRLLEQQSVRVEEQLKRLNEKQEDQRASLQELARDMKRTLDLLQATPGRR